MTYKEALSELKKYHCEFIGRKYDKNLIRLSFGEVRIIGYKGGDFKANDWDCFGELYDYCGISR